MDTAITRHTMEGGAQAPPSSFQRLRQPGLANLLITGGESGERARIAREFHAASWLRMGPFVMANARHVDWPAALLQALLRHTARVVDTPLLRAEGGTLLLDEIDHLSVDAQRLLFEFLRRGRSDRACDVGWAGRIAAGATGDLGVLVANGRFLAPLQDALDKIHIDLGSAL
ncbi:MAG: sigma 54-interacting transcriptional regulator [Candidatus Eisenbacteria bacterium]